MLALGAALILTGCGLVAPAEEVSVEPTTTAEAPTTAVPSSPAETTGGAAPSQPSHTPSAVAAGDLIVRVVGVVDGDTLRVSVDGVTERLRIIGIDAPELSQGECYGQEAASRMQSLVQSRDVRILADPTQADRDRYDRILRHVFTLDGVNVAHTLILEGLGREYTYDQAYASRADYLQAQEIAQAGRLGIWSGACAGAGEQSAVPLVPQPGSTDTEQCLIKGNINRQGEKIYHVPGGRSYADTIIDEYKGEAWFCTEQEAVEAGWRRALR